MIKCLWCKWFKCIKVGTYHAHLKENHPTIWKELESELIQLK